MEIYNGKYCVYIHTNKINGKKYVGQTCQKPEYRWNSGKGYKDNSYFWRAIQKYEWDNFDHEIVASNLTKEEVDNFERLLIRKLDLLDPNKGYNLQDGGSHGQPSEISRINISNAAKKRNQNSEWRRKQSESHIGLQVGENNGMYGKKHSEETIHKLREASTGKHPSEETLDKMRESHLGEKNSMYGKHHTNETKRKIGEAAKGENNANAKKVNQYSLDWKLIKTWSTMKLAGKTLDIPPQNISRCCRTAKGTAGGFIWRYADEVNTQIA
jgi:group I intron endonuclease